LYWFNWISFSPKLALLLGLLENILFLFIILRKSWIFIFSFVVINLSIKILPLYLLRKDKIDVHRDFEILIFIFLLYVLWIFVNKRMFVFRKMYEHTPGTNILANCIRKLI
jgi:hypothetical protein